MSKALINKNNTIPLLLGIILASGIFGICMFISIHRDKAVLSDVLQVTRLNEQRVGQVLEMQMTMTAVMSDLLDGMASESLSERGVLKLRSCRLQLDSLAKKQLELMSQVASQDLPAAPLRIWTSKSLRDRYFAERAQLAVLKDRVSPLMLSAEYLVKAFADNGEGRS